MKLIKIGVIAAVAAIALFAVAGTALATPTGTFANGNAPFITPAGNTTNSSVTASGTGQTFAVSGFNVTCSVTGSGYVPVTFHTGAHITSISFFACTASLGNASVDTSCVNSTQSWVLHAKGTVAANSVSGTVNVTCPVIITITALGGLVDCDLTVNPTPSVAGIYTNVNTSLVVNGIVPFTRTGSSACPASGNATQTGTVTFKADTPNHNLSITNAS